MRQKKFKWAKNSLNEQKIIQMSKKNSLNEQKIIQMSETNIKKIVQTSHSSNEQNIVKMSQKIVEMSK